MVLLPEPFGPINPRISPSFTSKETLLTAVKPPKTLVNALTANISAIENRREARGGRPKNG